MLSLLTVITTFGAGTALCMIFRRWWVAALLWSVFTIYLFATALTRLTAPEWVVYGIGLIGVILATIGVRALRRRGYTLFAKL